MKKKLLILAGVTIAPHVMKLLLSLWLPYHVPEYGFCDCAGSWACSWEQYKADFGLVLLLSVIFAGIGSVTLFSKDFWE